jgi:sec-independent protein translocase protein TatC
VTENSNNDNGQDHSSGPKDQEGFENLHVPPELPGGEDTSGKKITENKMGLLDHLDDLRSVLIQTFAAGLAASVLCWFWSASLLDLLVTPVKDQGVFFTAPNEAFLVRVKISMAVGIFIVAPFIFFRFYGFVLPGLYQKEKKVITPLLIATTALFYTGVAFAFMIVVPQVWEFLRSFGTDFLEPLIGVGAYFSFVSRMCLAFGIVFELPLVVLFLSVLGIVNPRMLLRTWRFALVLIALLSAFLTPPDVISQLMMAGPVVILYLGSVLVAIVITRRKDKED